MRVVRSRGESELTYVLLNDRDVVDLREALRKGKSPLASTAAVRPGERAVSTVSASGGVQHE